MPVPSVTPPAPAVVQTDTAAPEDSKTMIKVINTGPTRYVHGEHILLPHGDATVPENVAKLWMGHVNYGRNHVIAFSDEAAKAREAASTVDLKAKDEQISAQEAKIANLEKLLEDAKAAQIVPPTGGSVDAKMKAKLAKDAGK